MLDILRYLRHNIPIIRAIYLSAMPYRAARRFYFSGFAAVKRQRLDGDAVIGMQKYPT